MLAAGAISPTLRSLDPPGDLPAGDPASATGPQTLDTFAGLLAAPVEVEWNASSPLTPFARFVGFAGFTEVSGHSHGTNRGALNAARSQ